MPKKRKFKCEESLRKKYDATKFLFAEKIILLKRTCVVI